LLVALPLAPFVLLVPTISDRMASLGPEATITFEDIQKGYTVVDSYVWRRLLWDRALADSENARILGKGLGMLGPNAHRFFPLAEHAIEAHSAYIQSIYELGVLGLLSYIFLYVGIIIAVFLYRRRAPRLAYIIIG